MISKQGPNAGPAGRCDVIIAAVCEGCRTALEGESTTVQLTTGQIIATLDRGVTLRSTRSPASVNLCGSCAQPIRQVISQVLAGRAPTSP